MTELLRYNDKQPALVDANTYTFTSPWFHSHGKVEAGIAYPMLACVKKTLRHQGDSTVGAFGLLYQ